VNFRFLGAPSDTRMHFSLLLCVGKMARVLLALALLYVAVVAHAFRMSPQRFGGALIGGNRVRQSSSMIVNVKPDLFSGRWCGWLLLCCSYSFCGGGDNISVGGTDELT
jgi:hypothetical protein